MIREAVFSQYKKLILKAISQQTIYPFYIIERIFDKTKSFDKTLLILDASMEWNLHPFHIIPLMKSMQSEDK